MPKLDLSIYRIDKETKVDLKERPTSRDKHFDKDVTKDVLMPENLEKMSALQERLYAENRQALLIVFQAMDAAGKDGAIKHVMSGLNPQGTQVVSFKQPSAIELDHDYLWRIHKNVPARGNIGIFNRSHYEDVIITRVHDLLAQTQMPASLIGEGIWQRRYRQICDFERYLTENGIRIVKFFLHLSEEEQAKRLLARIDEKDKHWKFSASDIEERKFWHRYREAYEHMLSKTSTEYAPWYVVPADQKWFSRYVISEVVRETLEDMNPKFPKLSEEEASRLDEAKQLLEASLNEKHDRDPKISQEE